jgi:hypothetical protein
MPYPTAEEFKDLLRNRPLNELVQHYIFGGEPFAFRKQPRVLELLYRHLRNELNVEPQHLAIVGSAKIGFSVSPESFPRPFSATSDIDIVVVNETMYDAVWYAILKWHYPLRRRILNDERHWARFRKGELYWGWIAPDRILFDVLTLPDVLRPVHRFSAQWFNAFKSLSRYHHFTDRHISGRLYRTWEHARLYHVDSLRQLAEGLASEAGA